MAPYTVYQPRNKITYAKDGDWVRAVIDRRAPQPGVYRHKNKARSYVDWTDRELLDQVIAWCELARADKPTFLQKGDSHRPRTRTFIIPARCHKAAGAVVYDLRQILEPKQPDDRGAGLIPNKGSKHDQVVPWCELARADKRAFLQKGDSHRPRTRTFIIPARCHKAAGAVVYDLRQILEAQAAGRPLRWIDSETGIETGVPIPAIADDTPITPRLDKATFLRCCEAAGIQDLYGIQQVVSLGLVSASGCSRDTVLQMNYPAVSRHAAKAQAIADKEASQGFLSNPYSSLPLSPARINPFNAIER